MALIDILMNVWLWIGTSIFFLIFNIGILILSYFLLTRTHMIVEFKAFFSGTPIGIFFQDNKFAEWKPLTPVNGIIYDEYYGPFIVSTTYVDKKTKNLIMPFDVDMDGDRTTNLKALVNQLKFITSNEKSINELRSAISTESIHVDENIRNLTSRIHYGSLKRLFSNCTPHNIRSKIEKMVSEKLEKHGKVNIPQALIVFGAIFGIIVMATIIIKSMGYA